MLEKVPCGLVVRIWRFHRHGPGSITGMGNSRLCPFYFIIKQVKKSRFSNAIVRHHFLQLQSLKLCPVRRSYNFNNNCNLVLLSTSNTRLFVPCGLEVRIWRSHRHGPGSIPGMGNLPLFGSISFFIKKQEKWFTQLISRQSLLNLMLTIQSRLALEIF